MFVNDYNNDNDTNIKLTQFLVLGRVAPPDGHESNITAAAINMSLQIAITQTECALLNFKNDETAQVKTADIFLFVCCCTLFELVSMLLELFFSFLFVSFVLHMEQFYLHLYILQQFYESKQ